MTVLDTLFAIAPEFKTIDVNEINRLNILINLAKDEIPSEIILGTRYEKVLCLKVSCDLTCSGYLKNNVSGAIMKEVLGDQEITYSNKYSSNCRDNYYCKELDSILKIYKKSSILPFTI